VGRPPPPAEPSPVGSILSLLSAYSNSSSESNPASSGGTASTKASEPAASPKKEDPKSTGAPSPLSLSLSSPATSEPRPKTAQGVSQQSAVVQERSLPLPPPPLPLKDARRPQTPVESKQSPAQQPQQQPDDPVSKSTPLTNQSPPRPQIWRRRSLKAEKALPELKLASSHGSTASSQPPKLQEQASVTDSLSALAPPQAAFTSTSPAPSPLARVLNGLPGRNIRPAGGSKEPSPLPSAKSEAVSPLPGRGAKPTTTTSDPATESGDMGGKVSKIGGKISRKEATAQYEAREKSQQKSTPAEGQNDAKPHQQLASRRPPTPEYGRDDVKTPIVERVVSPVSPVSPATSPGQPAREIKREVSIPRKAVGGPELKSMKSIPNISTETSSGASSIPTISESVLGSISFANQTRPSPEEAKFPDRSTSRPPVAPLGGGLPRSPAPPGGGLPRSPAPPPKTHTPAASSTSSAQQDSWQSSFQQQQKQQPAVSRESAETVRPTAQKPSIDTTIRPPLAASSSPNSTVPARAALDTVPASPGHPAYFPQTILRPKMAAASVFAAPPLRPAHYRCFTGHRDLLFSANESYAVACQACGGADNQPRFTCSFCSLRVCRSCRDGLRSCDGDLARLLGGHKGFGDASSEVTVRAA